MTDSIQELPPIKERPIVTFALFAYNQEKFVREAVKAAFSQSYTPLEIILSDDCSRDCTFEILQEMASAYRGPHNIVVRQTKSNSGTLLHVAEVAKLARGELLVLAAGDDISLPERTEILFNEWQLSGAWGVFSRFHRIDETGKLTARDETIQMLRSPKYPLRKYFASRQSEVKIIHGATSAYDKRLFDYLDITPEDYILSEDGTLSVLLNLLNKDIRFVDASLVCYRENEQSLTNAGASGRVTCQKTRNDELAIERFAQSQANRCKLFLRFHENYSKNSLFQLDINRLRDEMQKQLTRAHWRKLSFGEQLKHLLKIRNLFDIKCYVPRLLPEPIFIFLKTTFKKMKSKP